jgi:hypothetical protein
MLLQVLEGAGDNLATILDVIRLNPHDAIRVHPEEAKTFLCETVLRIHEEHRTAPALHLCHQPGS